MEKQNTRNLSIDLLRVIAICMVVMIHSSAAFIEGKINPSDFLIGNIFNSLSRPAVPLFLMISGALLLREDKNKTFRDMLRSARNMLILIVIWAVIYASIQHIAFPLIQGNDISVSSFMFAIIKGHYHMWYLYMLIGIYLSIPILRAFVKKENKHIVLWYILIFALTTAIKPIVSAFSYFNENVLIINTIIDQFRLDYFAGYTAYVLAGWYIAHCGIEKRNVRKLIYLLGIFSACATILFTQFTGDYYHLHTETGLFVFLYSISIFLFVVRRNITSRNKWMILISGLSFGIYIVHVIFNSIIGDMLIKIQNPLLHIPLRFIFLFGCSFVVCYFLSKIPLLKKMIRC